MNLPGFAMDVAEALDSDPDRGRRILEVMRRYDVALTSEWLEQMQRYARRVYDGIEKAPERADSRAPG